LAVQDNRQGLLDPPRTAINLQTMPERRKTGWTGDEIGPEAPVRPPWGNNACIEGFQAARLAGEQFQLTAAMRGNLNLPRSSGGGPGHLPGPRQITHIP